jgi:hypothetical protein
MTERGKRLHVTADAQIAELIDLLSTPDEAALRRPCPGREKLGDGTIGASARHTADNYQRIAAFVQASDRTSEGHAPTQHHAYTADNIEPGAVIAQLSASRDGLGRIAALTDHELDAIPPKDSFRFCDGQRTLEQVIAGVLKHQRHQLDALRAAAAPAPGAA